MHPDVTPQLDLFADSRDVMLRNDAIEALLLRDATSAVAAQRALADFAPRHDALALLHVLIAALAPGPGTAFMHRMMSQDSRCVLRKPAPCDQARRGHRARRVRHLPFGPSASVSRVTRGSFGVDLVRIAEVAEGAFVVASTVEDSEHRDLLGAVVNFERDNGAALLVRDAQARTNAVAPRH